MNTEGERIKIYFSHPTVTYGSDTEKKCIEIIKNHFEQQIDLINPADYGLKHDLRSKVKGADVLVGLSISGKFTFLVWNELKEGKTHGADVYIIDFKDKENISKIIGGIPQNFEKLSKEESKAFTEEIMKKNRDSIWSILLGKHSSPF